MIFQNSNGSPQAFMRIGLISLTIAIVVPDLIHATAPFGVNSLHFVCGVLFGISSVLMVASVLPQQPRE